MAKIAFVIQRYGPEVIGGAESYCLQLAEKLVSQLGWDVTVYTSAAIDYMSWKNHYPATAQNVSGVNVLRFRTIMPRLRLLFRVLNAIMIVFWQLQRRGLAIPLLQRLWEHLWFRFQGPWVPQLLKQLSNDQSQYDKIIFVTYLYYPAIFGARLVGDKALIIPTAHDEPAFSSLLVRDMLQQIPSILCLTEAEQALVYRLMPDKKQKISMLGYALDLRRSTSEAAGNKLKVSQAAEPFILYLGRISSGKNVDELIRTFKVVTSLLPTRVRLFIAGQLDSSFGAPWDDDVIYVGRVSEDEKDWLIRHSLAVVNPSRFESLSLLVIEAMLYGKPALVNDACDVLDFYTKHTETVLPYHNPEMFGAALHSIVQETLAPSDAWRQKLARTQRWSEQRFDWEKLLIRLKQAIDR